MRISASRLARTAVAMFVVGLSFVLLSLTKITIPVIRAAQMTRASTKRTHSGAARYAPGARRRPPPGAGVEVGEGGYGSDTRHRVGAEDAILPYLRLAPA